jgi:site-specific DNA-methyltransferase (adenine-specific)
MKNRKMSDNAITDCRQQPDENNEANNEVLLGDALKGSSKEKIGHPSQKPIALIKQLIESSSRKGDTVLDPFLGSGTTAAAAQELGRHWVGIEINPDYVKIAQQRIRQETDPS